MVSSVGLILAKSKSKRLPNKNTLPVNGKPMWQINTEKCLDIFDKVYVSSDSDEILNRAEYIGAIGIKRRKELCGDVPNITVYRHALKFIDADAIVAVQANSPTIEPAVIRRVKEKIDAGISEVMTCDVDGNIYGSVWGLSREKIENYEDPYKPTPVFLVRDTSIDVHTIEDYNNVIKFYEQ